MLYSFCYSQETYIDSSVYDNGNLEYKGMRYKGENGDYQIGLWQYWYEDGHKELESFEDTSNTSRNINMWSADGVQILKDGRGYYYSIEPQSELTDSLVFQIKDSIKQGEFKRYRSYHGDYFLVETGMYENEKQSGKFSFRDTVLKVIQVRYYADDKQNGTESNYYYNGKLKDSVNYLNDNEEGEYKEYSKDQILIKSCSYHQGRLIGNYSEYYNSGKLKLKGKYIQGLGYEKIHVIGIVRNGKIYERTETRLINDKPLKQGRWICYDECGKIIKKLNYYRNIKTKNNQ